MVVFERLIRCGKPPTKQIKSNKPPVWAGGSLIGSEFGAGGEHTRLYFHRSGSVGMVDTSVKKYIDGNQSQKQPGGENGQG